ncbi:hypothetical protein Taro_004168 [Colocasia esculenta]|uniref:Uncharacterized protein n=1 Tax=Colocasia esculenta TaxID=4460 RepID=A0A843TQX2_COLES|nr:hypothetical protein [Colocasia esculenta]
MGGKRRSSSSSAKSFFSIFFKFTGKHHSRKDIDDFEPYHGGRVWTSDEDRDRWVAEPNIDVKATEFIANFYKKRVADSGRQTVAVQS